MLCPKIIYDTNQPKFMVGTEGNSLTSPQDVL